MTRLEPGDYTGEDGLLYCGKCRTPKQFRMEAPPLEGRLDTAPKQIADVFLLHGRPVLNVKPGVFHLWAFADWPTMQEENIGYLLWGGVGTGKSYFAGCIANALMEQEVDMPPLPLRLSSLAQRRMVAAWL